MSAATSSRCCCWRAPRRARRSATKKSATSCSPWSSPATRRPPTRWPGPGSACCAPRRPRAPARGGRAPAARRRGEGRGDDHRDDALTAGGADRRPPGDCALAAGRVRRTGRQRRSLISILLLHHREDLYPEPFDFRPERWLDRKPGTYEWIPFGGGIRRCLGAALAMAEQRVVLEAMARRLDLEAEDPAPERALHRNVTMIPAARRPRASSARARAEDARPTSLHSDQVSSQEVELIGDHRTRTGVRHRYRSDRHQDTSATPPAARVRRRRSRHPGERPCRTLRRRGATDSAGQQRSRARLEAGGQGASEPRPDCASASPHRRQPPRATPARCRVH